uniref:Uncharacterized protein n=1 Tax=Anguilla anguilla TaxID=7936 RepID=A0A0E9XES4_ANGAN
MIGSAVHPHRPCSDMIGHCCATQPALLRYDWTLLCTPTSPAAISLDTAVYPTSPAQISLDTAVHPHQACLYMIGHCCSGLIPCDAPVGHRSRVNVAHPSSAAACFCESNMYQRVTVVCVSHLYEHLTVELVKHV